MSSHLLWPCASLALVAFACERVDGPRAEEVSSREELALRVSELQQELRSERAAREADQEDWTAERGRLEGELQGERAARFAREEEWLRYLQGVGALRPDSLPKDKPFEVQMPIVGPLAGAGASAQPAQPAPKTEAETRAQEESVALKRSLRNLLALEAVSGLDLLEVGRVHEGWTGPVVFRLLDGTGHLAGSLYAERLRLEGSLAGHTLTLVLEDGYETRGGERHPFDGGAPETGLGGLRRIQLPGVDPERWVEACPKLFGEKALEEPADDGSFDLAAVHTTMNELFKQDAAAGYYRIKELGGVVQGAMRKVHLERYDKDGKLERRLFADRMQVLAEGESVQIVLEDGVQVRGDEKAPFLDGRFRIFLPRAKAETWRKAGVPGLAQPPPRTAAVEQQR